jgi:hypothetical protein
MVIPGEYDSSDDAIPTVLIMIPGEYDSFDDAIPSITLRAATL